MTMIFTWMLLRILFKKKDIRKLCNGYNQSWVFWSQFFHKVFIHQQDHRDESYDQSHDLSCDSSLWFGWGIKTL